MSQPRTFTTSLLTAIIGGISGALAVMLILILTASPFTQKITHELVKYIDPNAITPDPMSVEDVVHRVRRSENTPPPMTSAHEVELNATALVVASQIIAIESEDLKHGYGNGYMLMPGVAVSCAHVVEAARIGQEVNVHCQDGVQTRSTIIASDSVADVAILKATCPAKRIELADATDPNDGLVIIGHVFEPNGEHYKFYRPSSFIKNGSWAVLSDEMKKDQQQLSARLHQTAAQHLPEPLILAGALVPGNSGSPVIRRKDGAVVGHFIIFDSERNLSYAVPAETIRDLLRVSKIAY